MKLGKQYFVGFADEISIGEDRSKLVDNFYPMPSLEETQERIQYILDHPDEEVDLPVTSEPEAVSVKRNNSTVDDSVTLQPRSHDHNKTYKCISINFDVDACMELVCPRIFESLCKQDWDKTDDEDETPSVFSKLGKISEIGKDLKKGKLGKLDLKEGKLGNQHLWGGKNEIPEGGDGNQYSTLEEERDSFLGVEAHKAAGVIGFLEQPWKLIVPNQPLLTDADVSRILEKWQTYSQQFMIKLKWLYLIRKPVYIKVSSRMIENDIPFISDNDRKSLLAYCLEFWNKQSLNYLWKFDILSTDDLVPIWKTRVVCIFK